MDERIQQEPGFEGVAGDALRVLARARLLALDVDGVLTDGRVVHGPDGETQSFCVYDGQGLAWLARAGVTVSWITGRGCAATATRARELDVTELHVRVGPKEDVLRSIQERLSIEPSETVAMGDDLPDLGLARASGFFAAPANARDEVKAVAQLVTRAHGGAGAVRELVELVLRAQGRWGAIVGPADR